MEVLEAHGQGPGAAKKEDGPQAPPAQRLELPPSTGCLRQVHLLPSANRVRRLRHVFIPAAREIYDDYLVFGQPGRATNNFRDGVGTLKGGDDALQAREFGERVERLVVGGIGVFDTLKVAQPGVLGPDGRVIQTRRDTVGKLNLAELDRKSTR